MRLVLDSLLTVLASAASYAFLAFLAHASVSAQGLNVVKVSVADVRVEHEVRLMDFTKWLERVGGSPREVSDRHKIRSILGMPISR